MYNYVITFEFIEVYPFGQYKNTRKIMKVSRYIEIFEILSKGLEYVEDKFFKSMALLYHGTSNTDLKSFPSVFLSIPYTSIIYKYFIYMSFN